MSVLYFYLDANFGACKTYVDRIAKIQSLIDSLFIAATKISGTANHASYKIDDGQSVQEVIYRSPAAIMEAIKSYEFMITYYQNKLLGNEYRNIGGKNLNRRNC